MKKLLGKILGLDSLKIAVAVIFVGVAGYGAYAFWWPKAPATPQYITAKVERGTLVVSVTGSGQIASSNQTNIQAQIAGTVIAVPVVNNQKVSKGELLVELDPVNEQRAVRNAKANVESAELALQTLEQPATTSTLLQAQQAVAQAQQTLQNDVNNVATDYNNAYTNIANTFTTLPGVMNGLNNILYGTALNKGQADVDSYANLIRIDYPDLSVEYNQSAVSSYQTAVTTYNQNLADYKSSTIYSSTSTIESLLNESYNTLKIISVAANNGKNLLDLVNTDFTQNQLRNPPAQLTTDEVSMGSYLTTINSQLTTITQILNTLQSDKKSVITANLAVGQTQAALAQLEAGPTPLQIQAQELSLTQAKNTLSDARQNLEYDYVRTPFSGIVTNISAKIGQPAAGMLAVVLSSEQLAQATFNEVDIVSVKVGQKANITFDALPNLSITGTVSEVDTLGVVAQGVVSYNIQAALDVPNPLVKPGMSDTIAVITNVRQDVLFVPNSAITSKQGVSTLQVMGADGIPRVRQVATGAINDSQTEILSGVKEGETIVIQVVNAASAQSSENQSSRGGLGGIRIPGLGGGIGR